jgi:hypothetical protein
VAAPGSPLTEDQMVSALGFAANYSSGMVECWQAGTMEGHFHGGMAARTGIISVTLAKLGVIAAESSFEGGHGFYLSFAGTLDHVPEVTADLGKRYMIMEVLYKPYRCFGQQFKHRPYPSVVARDTSSPGCREVVGRSRSSRASSGFELPRLSDNIKRC